jgi:dihydroorotate dehydrogenase electron transfer subunit
MRDYQGTTEENREIDPGYFLLRLRLDEPPSVRPGQFAMVKPHGLNDPVLRRAFAVYRADGRSVEFVYQVLGRGTEALAKVKPGDPVDALLPLGNSFPLEPVTAEGRTPLVAVGGVGSASALMFVQELTRVGAGVKVFFGGRSAGHLPGWRDFDALGCPVVYTTDDGSKGRRGFVTAALEDELDSGTDAASAVVYHCGPWPMMARVAAIAARRGVPSFASLEAPMACGIGICVACVVETCGGYFKGPFKYQKVCTEGPVFPSEAIVW